jgi:hypothetical protein
MATSGTDSGTAAISVDQSSLASFGQFVDALVAFTGRTPSDAVTYAALKVCESGRSISRPGSRQHKIESNPEYKAARKWQKHIRGIEATSYGKYRIVRYNQPDSSVWYVPTDWKDDRRRSILNRGLAQKTWSVMVGQLGALKGSDVFAGNEAVAKQWSRISSWKKGSAVLVRIENRLAYLEKAYPGIQAEAQERGKKALAFLIQKQVDAYVKSKAEAASA